MRRYAHKLCGTMLKGTDVSDKIPSVTRRKFYKAKVMYWFFSLIWILLILYMLQENRLPIYINVIALALLTVGHPPLRLFFEGYEIWKLRQLKIQQEQRSQERPP